MSEAPEQTWPIGFYAPGDYWGTCAICGKQHLADKRAVNCADCTLQVCYRELEKLRAQPAIDIEAIRREARREALEGAAKVADAQEGYDVRHDYPIDFGEAFDIACGRIAAAIRAMKGEER